MTTRDGWMELNEFCQKYNERRNTVHKRVKDNTWPRGEFYSSPSGSISYVHEARAVEWLRQHGKLKTEVS